ncbi:unannotated protein [freshwater metagenome]|uniref:Unannotated protein n=1 Tax=freshwater metagenome TaxID=449393 RepID=A0A6J6FC47_9ZZZZ
MLAAAFPALLEELVFDSGKGSKRGATLRESASAFSATFQQILNCWVVRAGVVVGGTIRIRLKLFIGNGDTQVVTERLEDIERQFLHLVNGVSALKRLSETVSLHGFRKNYRRLALVRHRFRIRRIELAVVVTAAFERPNLFVRPISDHRSGARVTSEEVLTDVSTRFGLIRLEVTVGGVVHQIAERTVVILAQQFVPFAAPHNLDDMPTGTAEKRLQLLNDFSVTANRAIESLQIAVNDKREVVEAIVCCELQSAARFNLIHLTIAKERPDMLV